MRKVTITLEVGTGESVSNEAILKEIETLLGNGGSGTTIYCITNKDIYDGCVDDNLVTTFEHYSAINTKAEEEYYEGKLSVVNKVLTYLEEEKHNRDIFMKSLGKKDM